MSLVSFQGREAVPAWPVIDDGGCIAAPCACGCVHYGYPGLGSIQLVERYCDGAEIALIHLEPNGPVSFDDLLDFAQSMKA
jgi:hypothetical protein